MKLCIFHLFIISTGGKYILTRDRKYKFVPESMNMVKGNGGVSEEHRRLEKCECGGGFVPIRV